MNIQLNDYVIIRYKTSFGKGGRDRNGNYREEGDYVEAVQGVVQDIVDSAKNGKTYHFHSNQGLVHEDCIIDFKIILPEKRGK